MRFSSIITVQSNAIGQQMKHPPGGASVLASLFSLAPIGREGRGEGASGVKTTSAVILFIALIASLLLTPSANAQDTKPIRALLVIGGCCHDYAHQKNILPEGISARANVEWTVIHEGDGSTTHKMSIYNDPDWAKNFDIVVHDECCADVKDKDFVENILKPHRAGLPAVNLHCAMHCYRVNFDTFKDWFEFTGIDSRAHGAQEPIALTFVDAHHPITQGMQNWTTIPEELYNNIHVYDTITPLIYGKQGRDNNVVAWVNNFHGTRVFSTTLGHNNETVGDARYLDLVTRGLLWAVDKLNDDYLKPARRVYAAAPASGKKVLAPINLALHKSATASGSQDGHPPTDAVDGESDTRWCAPDNGNNYWWQVDLGKSQDITGCRIAWEQEDRPYQYTVASSKDGQTWQTLFEEKGQTPRPQNDDHKFTDNARYVRVTITRAPDGSWASFFEFEVFGKEMVEKTATPNIDPRLREVKAPDGFDRTLFAAPPDINYPTCIAAEPTGEVFIGVDQNGSLDTKPGRGWVVRCLDTDGDGAANKFNIFAKMDSPRGIVYDHNTLYVMHPPVLEAFYDDNGTGTANRSEVLVRGLGHDLNFRGADHTCNGVRMGIDGWLYIALGDYGAIDAVGKDGKEIQVHGGGIVRVRPDGSDLEIVVQGTRNIYDVAIDPLMDIFTCDNTNDGDDWNVRLSHMIPTANYGYPSLFRHFSDEMIPTMVDYGGGSPTGSIFLDEPGFPNGLGYGLYTCQWGWNTVTRHPLKQSGASFAADRESFISLTRPTGIDEDGQGHLYVASWKGATFNYAGPNAGYVTRITPPNNKPIPFPDLQKATEKQLLDLLASPSAVWRFHVQHEILRRDHQTDEIATGLQRLAMDGLKGMPVRVAAIFTANQLFRDKAHEMLQRCSEIPDLRPFAIKALSDRKEDAAKLPTTLFVSALKDANPDVRLQAVIALNRLGRREAAEAVLPLVADSDYSVAHVAFRALASFHAGEICLKAFDDSKTALFPGAARVLRNLHDENVVNGLIQRVDTMPTSAPAFKLLSGALCRLYYREADYDGSWWGTRPDTSGPYFKRVTWEQSAKIAEALQKLIARADDDTLRFLLGEFQLQKIESAELISALVRVAKEKPSIRSVIIDLAAHDRNASSDLLSFLQTIVLDKQMDSQSRTHAFDALNASDKPEAAVQTLLSLSADKSQQALSDNLREAFVREGRRGNSADYFIKLSTSDNADQSELGYAVLLQISSARSGRQARGNARDAIDAGWKSSRVASLLRAVGLAHADAYLSQARTYANDSRANVAAAAAYALGRLGSTVPPPQAAPRPNTIATMSYEQVMTEATQIPGDPKQGAQFFDKLGCVKCHTVLKTEPLKGPFLGDIFARYKRPEIIESILRPSAQIAQGFTPYTIETKDGTDYDGFIVRESGDEIELRNLVGATVIKIKDIEKRITRATSIMPEGLADQLTPAELASLLAYLQSLNPKS